MADEDGLGENIEDGFAKNIEDGLATSIEDVPAKKIGLRGGTVPWRYAPGTVGTEEVVEVFVTESVRYPGRWAFPGGGVIPGEDVLTCAVRETFEEIGVTGNIGCFLGKFAKQSCYFSMEVHTIHDEGSDFWKDKGCSVVDAEKRQRRWLNVSPGKMETSRSLMHKSSPSILDAFLDVPPKGRMDQWWRRTVDPPKILLPSRVVNDAVWLHCSMRGTLLSAEKEGDNQTRFSFVTAALWEADVVISVCGAEDAFLLGLAVSRNCPVLICRQAGTSLQPMVASDARVIVKELSDIEGSDVRDSIDDFLERKGWLVH